MNKITAISSLGRSDGLGASFPSHNLAGGGVAKGSPPAFLIRRIGGFQYLTPLQVIPFKHKL